MARNFDGSTDYIDTPLTVNDVTNTGTQTQPFTFSAWVRLSAGHGSFPVIFSSSGSIQLFWGVHIGSDAFKGFNIYFNNLETKNASVPSDNVWYQVVATYNGGVTSGLNIYVNGVDATVGNQGSYNGASTADHMQIANGTFGGNSFWKGDIADMAVWNVALTAGEAAGLAGGMRPSQVRQQSLIAWWPIDGIESTEPDLSGFARNGTLTGTSLAAGPPLTMFTPRWISAQPIGTSGPAGGGGNQFLIGGPDLTEHFVTSGAISAMNVSYLINPLSRRTV